MLKIIQTAPNTLQLQAGYLKNLLIIIGIVIPSLIATFLLSYEHLSIKANRSKNTFSAQQFSFLKNFESQNFQLSEIDEMWANYQDFETIGHSQSNDEMIMVRPILKMKNGEEIFLVDDFKEEVFTFNDTYVGFNHFLKHTQENTFSEKSNYTGVLGWTFSTALGFTLLITLVVSFFLGDVKITLDKKTGTYKIKYLVRTRKNKQGNLSEIQNVLLISEVSKSFGKKPAGLYLNLKNKETILLKGLGFYDQGQVTPESLAPFQANGKKVADFLELEFVEITKQE